MNELKKSIEKTLSSLVDESTAKAIMKNLEPGAPLPEGEREYLTVQEFIEQGETATDIIILTNRFGNYRCHCYSPVRDLVYEEKRAYLAWSDETGDPTLTVNNLSVKCIDLNDGIPSKYTTSIFRIKK